MGSIRPFQAPQDFDIMLKLIEEGFQYPENPEWNIQEDEKESLGDGIRSAKSLWPLIRFLQIFAPFLKDLMCGYLYEENNRPAGLVNYGRQKNTPEWFIGNVTVLPEYRRRGIARQLIQATVKELERRNAKLITLEVIDENKPAYNLYSELGFEGYSSTSQYDYMQDGIIQAVPLPEQYTLREIGRSAWRTIFEFSKRTTPEEITRYEPVLEDRFRPPAVGFFLGPLIQFISGNNRKRFAIFEQNGQMVAFGQFQYRQRAGGLNSAEVHIDPAHSEIAIHLVGFVLSKIQKASPGRRIELHLKDWQPSLGEAAANLGCKKRCSYHKMGMLFE
jgi:ribosomal protein S18 acetylase RimI-like enzyme